MSAATSKIASIPATAASDGIVGSEDKPFALVISIAALLVSIVTLFVNGRRDRIRFERSLRLDAYNDFVQQVNDILALVYDLPSSYQRRQAGSLGGPTLITRDEHSPRIKSAFNAFSVEQFRLVSGKDTQRQADFVYECIRQLINIRYEGYLSLDGSAGRVWGLTVAEDMASWGAGAEEKESILVSKLGAALSLLRTAVQDENGIKAQGGDPSWEHSVTNE